MRSKGLPLFVVALCSAALSVSFAQRGEKKVFSYEQAFGAGGPGRGSDITARLPEVRGWLDDNHYLESRSEDGDGQRKLYAVSAADGSWRVHVDYPEIQKNLPKGVNAQGSAANTEDY
ncbi:MAG: hypothetical protein FJW35_13335, partial [Acidobacteria bacterium]|nr:hypothetical protein [Acidobacteriota bacterium]